MSASQFREREVCCWIPNNSFHEIPNHKVQIYVREPLKKQKNDPHPRAQAHSDCVGTGFYECVLSLGISETFPLPVRFFLIYTRPPKLAVLLAPVLAVHQKAKSPTPEIKKSPGGQNTPVRGRIHEKDY